MAKLTVGEHTAVAREFEFGKSSTNKNYISVRFEIVEGDSKGATITWRGFLSDGAKKRTLTSLRYCGWEGNDLATLDGLGKAKVSLSIANETYNEKTYMRVNWVNQLRAKKSISAGENALSADDVARLSAELSMDIDTTPVEECVIADEFIQASRVAAAEDVDFPL